MIDLTAEEVKLRLAESNRQISDRIVLLIVNVALEHMAAKLIQEKNDIADDSGIS